MPAPSPQAPYFLLSDPVQQYLLLSGKTLFKGCAFTDLHRLALDMETATAAGYGFSNPLRKEDRILSIGLMDNLGNEEILLATDYGEKFLVIPVSFIKDRSVFVNEDNPGSVPVS